MPGIQMNRTASGVILPAEVSAEIWSKAIEESVVMRLAQRINLPAPGVSVQIVTSDPEADFVNETDEINVGRHTLANKTMAPHKLGVIEPFSLEFRRDLNTLYGALVNRLPQAIGRRFDTAVLHAINPPAGNFDTLAGAPSLSITSANLYSQILAGIGLVAAAGGDADRIALSSQGEALALGALDNTGRPLFIGDMNNGSAVGSVLGRSIDKSKAVYRAGTPATLGFLGDWTTASWGQVAQITISTSDQATLNDNGAPLNLWQRDMFAIKVTTEVGFRLKDAANFVRLTS